MGWWKKSRLPRDRRWKKGMRWYGLKRWKDKLINPESRLPTQLIFAILVDCILYVA